jgi:capsular exopolysaccharide synthesis family protein
MRESVKLVKSEAALPEKAPHLAENTLAPYYGYDVNAPETEENSAYERLREYWLAFRKHIWLVAGICALATLLSAIYVARQPDVYEAKSRVQIDLEVAPPPLTGSKSTNFVFGGYQDPTYFNTQIQLLTSVGLLQRVVKTLDLENNPAFLGKQAQKASTWDSLKRMFGFGNKEQSPAEPSAEGQKIGKIAEAGSQDDWAEVNRMAPFVNMLGGGLNVKEVENTRLIEIRYRHTDPELATKIVNTVAETLRLSNMERRADSSSTAGDFLNKRIAQLQNEIRAGEERLNNYAKSRQIISLQPESNPTTERLAGLNKQLLEAEDERKKAEAAYQAAQRPGAAEAISDAENKQVTAQIEARLTELRQKKEQLLVEYTEKYPEVQEVEKQIAVLEKQLLNSRTGSTKTLTTNLETKYRQALQREQGLRVAYEKQRGETLNQNEAATGYRIMQQEIDANKQILSNLLEQQKTSSVITQSAPNNISVRDVASIPRGPVGPRRMPFVALAGLLSLVFGVGLARYLEYLDDAIHSVEEVEKHVRLPALAIIPAFSGRGRGRLMSSVSTSVTALQRRRDAGAEELLFKLDARSPLSEAYRQLRTSILLSSAGGAPKSLLVTSSQPSEGKTTTVVNTAAILAQSEETKVIVIDADMRRPRLHSLFNLSNQAGLSSILAGRLDEQGMLNLVQTHDQSGLYVLTSGPVPPNPAELLGSQQMRQLMAVLEANFSHVIVDSPPIVSFTDGVLIATLTDGVLLVVEAGRTSRNLVRRARQLLTDVGAKIFGVVLNNLDIKSRAYYDYNGYYYQHYYDNTEKD